jgi:type III secretion protein N (ATPase)
VLASVSRVMTHVVSPEHRHAAEQLRALMARYQELEMLIQIGEYQAGSDALADRAIATREAWQAFLTQPPELSVPFDTTLAALRRLADRPA